MYKKKEKIYITLAVLAVPIIIIGLVLGVMLNIDPLWSIIIALILGLGFGTLSFKEALEIGNEAETETTKEDSERFQKIIIYFLCISCFSFVILACIYAIILWIS
jgi:F0F1-type ATP synthase assembly protein I